MQDIVLSENKTVVIEGKTFTVGQIPDEALRFDLPNTEGVKFEDFQKFLNAVKEIFHTPRQE